MTTPEPTTARIATYREFWPFYLREHSRPATRAWHYFGTGAAILCVIAAIADTNPWLLLLALAFGYGPAWMAHFFVEKNRPATFGYPLWGFFSDIRMFALWIAGRLDRDLERAGIAPDGTVSSVPPV
jgi:hypothetical protein